MTPSRLDAIEAEMRTKTGDSSRTYDLLTLSEVHYLLRIVRAAVKLRESLAMVDFDEFDASLWFDAAIENRTLEGKPL